MILYHNCESVLTALVSISTTLKNHFAFALLCFALLCFDSQAGASSRVDRRVVVDKPALSGAVRVLDRLSCQILAPAEPVNFL
jgi:hypothetical protein